MNFSKFLRTPFFIEYLRMTASILQQLLVLYFSITYSRHRSSSERSLVWKKFTYISQVFYGFRFIFTLSVTQSVCCTLRHHIENTQLLFCGQCFLIFSWDKQQMILGVTPKYELCVSLNLKRDLQINELVSI